MTKDQKVIAKAMEILQQADKEGKNTLSVAARGTGKAFGTVAGTSVGLVAWGLKSLGKGAADGYKATKQKIEDKKIKKEAEEAAKIAGIVALAAAMLEEEKKQQ